MISGRVSAELDPLVVVEIRNGQGDLRPVEVIVDTGFSGELALPPDLIQSLELDYIDDVSVALVDGREGRFRAYDGVVSWHGRRREVMAIDLGGDPLLGMALLLECRLTVSARPGGAVLIEEEEP